MSIIIFEGITASGKTSIIKFFKEMVNNENDKFSSFFLSEHLTQRIYEHIKDQAQYHKSIKDHALNLAQYLLYFHNCLSNSKFNDKVDKILKVFLERFLATYYLDDVIDETFINVVLDLLSPVKIYQVNLFIPEEKLLQRIQNTVKHRNSVWKDYLTSLGNEKQIMDHFIRLQTKLYFFSEHFKDRIHFVNLQVDTLEYEKLAHEAITAIFKLEGHHAHI